MPRRSASRTVASYPHLALHEHTLFSEDPQQPGWPIVTLTLTNWCVTAALTTSSEWVLVEQHRHGVDALTWEPAGGIIDPEETPDEAARRELLEETGYGGGTLEPLGWVHPNPALSDNRAFLFLMTGAERLAEPLSPPDEQTQVVLLGTDDMRRSLVDGRVTHALAVLTTMRALARVEQP